MTLSLSRRCSLGSLHRSCAARALAFALAVAVGLLAASDSIAEGIVEADAGAVPAAERVVEPAAEPGAASAPSEAEPDYPCGADQTLATGRPDPALFALEASRGVQAFWCETYDEQGLSHRAGPYWDRHADGSVRVRARYVDSRIEGPVEVFSEEGGLWLRGRLDRGVWNGTLELFHANGARWISAQFRAGALDGSVETFFPDGSLESETRFEAGREDGIASSYFPAAAGGGLRSRVRVEADRIVDRGPQDEPAPPAALSARVDPAPLAQHIPAVAAGAGEHAADAALP